MTGPLAGVRILDLTSVVMGPYATTLLGDLGADVIKLEPPEGDIVRQVGPSRSGEMGGMFLHANRSKRSLAVDLKSAAGREIALRLAARCDVLVHNLRPQAMARLGLGYAAVAAVNSGIVYLGAFGFGQDGPYADRPAYDDLIQAACAVPALMDASGADGPRYVPVNIADRLVGLHAATAILAALRHRDRTGEGQQVDVPMFETMASLVLGDHLGGLSYRPPLDEGGYARILSRHRRPFRTRDGHLCAVIYTDRHWRRFFAAVGRPERMDDPRFASHASRLRAIDAIYAEVDGLFSERPTAEWVRLLTEADIPHAVLHTPLSLREDPHLRAVGFFEETEHPSEGAVVSMRIPSRWSASPPAPSRLAPRLGEHTRAILADVGYDEAEIESLVAGGHVVEAMAGGGRDQGEADGAATEASRWRRHQSR